MKKEPLVQVQLFRERLEGSLGNISRPDGEGIRACLSEAPFCAARQSRTFSRLASITVADLRRGPAGWGLMLTTSPGESERLLASIRAVEAYLQGTRQATEERA